MSCLENDRALLFQLRNHLRPPTMEVSDTKQERMELDTSWNSNDVFISLNPTIFGVIFVVISFLFFLLIFPHPKGCDTITSRMEATLKTHANTSARSSFYHT